ncbi:MAG: ATP synthase F1 subunit gamma, partial [Bacteroidota bacterium]
MANLKEIRTRISSVTSTRQITSAMKMVAAAKLRKSQETITQLRPYSEKLTEVLRAISDTLVQDEENLFVKKRSVQKALLVVVTSNKGLCGNFNSTIIKQTTALAQTKYRDLQMNQSLDLLIIGKKAYDHFKKRDFTIYKSDNEIIDHVNYEGTSKLAEEIIHLFLSGTYDHIDIVYNQFINPAVQKLRVEQYLPMVVEKPEEEAVPSTFVDYIFEPSKKYIVEELIPKSLRLQFHKALLDSSASEHGARMTAMHKATDNATELLKELRLDYNKARQASITNEILE